MISEEAKSKARRLMEARTARDEAKQASVDAENDYREIEAEFYDELEALRDPNDPNAKKASIAIPLGPPWGTVTFGQRETYYGRILDEEVALEWFETRQMVDEMTAPRFVKSRLNEIVRDAREQGEDMPPGVDYYANRGVRITREK